MHTLAPPSDIDKDQILLDIVDYVINFQSSSQLAVETARYCFIDAIGCAMLALDFKECTKLLGPTVPGTTVPNGVIIPGTNYELDPVVGAFNIGAMIRWLDYNDTWLAAEWGHPSDNLGAILSVADYVQQAQQKPITLRQVLEAMVKAYEIQGVLALENSFNRVGLDHVILVKVASTAVAAHLLGATRDQIFNALSNAWIDGGVLRTYRHYPNTGSRKSWAAGDQCQRAVFHALTALKGEMGYPTALTAPGWGFYDVQFGSSPFKLQRAFGEYVMENILFKVSFPAEFHAQTAVECAIVLHPLFIEKYDQVKAIHITTHKSAMRIINKIGELKNPADRDHCLQYMTAAGLLFGGLTADMYEDSFAADPRIDLTREKMIVVEDERYSVDYLHPEKRSIANAIQLEFIDGTFSDKIEVEYPIGHRVRREQAFPLIEQKFKDNLKTQFSGEVYEKILEISLDQTKFETTTVHDFLLLLKKSA